MTTQNTDPPSTVELSLPADGLDAEVRCFDADGKVTPTPHKIVVTPYFYSPKELAVVAYAKVFSGPEEVHRSIVQVAGDTGRMKLADRTQRSSPAFVSSAKGERSPSE